MRRKGVLMLVLSRKKSQTIVVGDDIRITIVELRGDKVRVGIDAPRGVTVHREEVYDAIQQEAEERLTLTGADPE
jgi:carbon storage regulator